MANSATVPVGAASALRPRTTAAKVITVAGLTAVMPIRVRYARNGPAVDAR